MPSSGLKPSFFRNGRSWSITALKSGFIAPITSVNGVGNCWSLIRRWENLRSNNTSGSGPGSVSYWKMDSDSRERVELLDVFSLELYGAMDAVVKIEGSRDIDSELLVIGPIEPIDGEVPLITDLDHKDKEEIDEALLSTESWDLATKLQENAEHIQSILKGENGGSYIVDIDVAREKPRS